MKLSISREIYKAYFALVKVLSIANQKGSRFGFPLPFLGVAWAGTGCNEIAAYERSLPLVTKKPDSLRSQAPFYFMLTTFAVRFLGLRALGAAFLLVVRASATSATFAFAAS